MASNSKSEEQPCPRDEAGLLSRLTFWWFNPMAKLALERNIRLDDLASAPADLAAEKLCGQLESKWDNLEQSARRSATGKRGHHSLSKAVAKTFFWPAFASSAGIMLLILSRMVAIVLLQQLLIWNSTNWQYAYALIFGIAFMALFDYMGICLSVFYALNLALKLRVSITMMMYKKMIWLNVADLPDNFMDEILNMFTNDVATFNERIRMLSGVVLGPLSLVLNAALMWWFMGWYSFIGVIYLLLYIGFQFASGKHLIKIKKKLAEQKGARIQLVINVLHGIKLIKMYAWEKHFAGIIAVARKKEVSFISKLLHHRIVAATMYNINGRLTFTWILLPYIFLGNHFLPEMLFPTLACCNLMRGTVVVFIITSITSITDIYVAFNRIQKFLRICEARINQTSTEKLLNQQPAVSAEGLRESLNKNCYDVNLKGVSFMLHPGDRMAIIGKVGSGKTVMLLNILKEVNFFEGMIKVTGKVSYVPQEPWIIAGTIQENILFGQPYDKTKLYEVLHACALLEDIQNISEGLETLVGEKGVSLSGGQKARINLARAVYSDADILLLDDPFSAVDVEVAKHLFYNCIQDYLKEKIVILTTHHAQYIQEINKIIVVENGYNLTEKYDSEGNLNDQLMNSSMFKDEDTPGDNMPSDNIKNKLPKNGEGNKPEITLILEANERDVAPGLVSLQTHWQYFSGESSALLVVLCITLIITFLALGSLSDYYLKILSSDGTFTGDTCDDLIIGSLFQSFYKHGCHLNIPHFYNTFCFLGTFASNVISTYLALFICGQMLQMTAKGMQRRMLDCTLRAKPDYFQKWHIGKFIDRFTVDIGIVDLNLPAAIIDTIGYIGAIITSLILMSIFNQWIIIPSAILIIIFAKLGIISSKISRTFLHLESSTRSLIYSQVATTLTGLPIIHSQDKDNFMIKKFQSNLNRYCAASYYTAVSACWNQTKVVGNSTLNSIIMMCILAIFITEMSSENIGIILTTLFMLLTTSILSITEIQQAEDQMHAVERILFHSRLESEAALKSSDINCPSPLWPSKGKIALKNVIVFYAEKQMALKGISLIIEAKEKIGIVGRTGAGKSSLFSALLRWIEPKGQLQIDGVTTTAIGLHDLRSKISIITQDPVLFNGTIKSNLDPFDVFKDEELYNALADVQMLGVIKTMPGGLSEKLTDNCTSLSVGEKQLLCLARVILRKSRILLLDEATANIDKRTDAIIQQTIREKFADCTVLTIAHRLETVMDSDRVLVLQNGEVVEFDEPYNLLKSRNGHLYSLLQSTGKFNEEFLLNVAMESHDKKRNLGCKNGNERPLR